jgi:flavin-dependent dehydrogenase
VVAGAVTSRTDVLIVGAGPAGSATAILLAEAGWKVTVVDRARFPRDKACSEFMSPATAAALDRLGALAALDAAAAHPAGTQVHGPRGSALTGLFARSVLPAARSSGLAVSRRTLDHALVQRARAAGATVLEGAAVRELLYDGGAVAGAMIEPGDGPPRTIQARLTVGADGLRSVIARRIGRRTHGRPRRIAFVAHVARVRGLGDVAEMHVSANGYVGLNPIGGDVANVALVIPAAAAGAARGDAADFFHRTLERFPGVAGRVDPSRVVREVMVTGPFAARSSRVTTDGALLVGDAAEFFDPFTGEGIYRALHGAELAALVAGAALRRPGIVRARALAPYRAERRRAFAGTWAVERIIAWMMGAPALFDRAVARLERRGLAHTLIGVTGDLVPAGAVLNPTFLLRTLL